LRQRQERIEQIRELGFEPYGRAFDFTQTIPDILSEFGETKAEDLPTSLRVRIAGRVKTCRRMGKAGFIHIQQNGRSLQIYVKKDALPEAAYKLYEILDIGDIIGVTGYLFRTRTGELSVHVEDLVFLSKIMLPLPEKWHGLEDVETRYRQRYVDLIANPEVRDAFVTRAKIVRSLRRQLDERGFLGSKRPSCSLCMEGQRPGPLLPITTRSTSTSTFGLRRNCT
jgi:lysyl-tRNA synthetase class 2